MKPGMPGFFSKEAIKNLKETHCTIVNRTGITFNGNLRIVRVEKFNYEWMILAGVRYGKGIAEFEEICEKPERIFYVEMQG